LTTSRPQSWTFAPPVRAIRSSLKDRRMERAVPDHRSPSSPRRSDARWRARPRGLAGARGRCRLEHIDRREGHDRRVRRGDRWRPRRRRLGRRGGRVCPQRRACARPPCRALVWDRQSGLHAGGGRPTVEFAAFCGALKVGWYFCEPRDPQAKGASSGCRTSSSGPSSRAGRSPTSSTSSSSSTPGLPSGRTRGCTRRCAAARSTGSSRSGE
jgi:hypothetical protein